MRRRTEKTIRKLAGVEDPRNPRLGPADARAPIARTRSIAYATADGIEHKSSSGSDANEQTVPGATDTDQNAEIMNQIIGVVDPTGGTNNAGGGNGQDRPADEVAQTKKGDATKKVTGDDLTTGTNAGSVSVSVNATDSAAAPPPPAGWSDPSTPPDSEAGKSWIIAGESDTYYQSTSNAFAAYQTHNPSQTSYSVTGGSGVVNIGWGVYLYSNDARAQPSNSVFAYKIDTPSGKTNLDADHPSDGVCAIYWDSATGKFKGHDLDPDCSAAQKAGTASVYVDENGVRQKVDHLTNGGFKLTDVDSSNVVDPAGYTRIYSADGILESITTTGVGGQVE